MILVIMAGGTIDAEPYPDPKHPPVYSTTLKESLVPAAMKKLGYECRFVQWSMKDSKEIGAGELQELARLIRDSAEREIIVTHGTDRMPENSRALQELLGGTEKIIVVTGAMMPLSNGPESDGYANLDYAARHIGAWPPGVHVVMHAKHFSPIGLKKNYATLTFEGDAS